ncbi:phosphonate ABC transporter ATP-binding protein [Corynebacterium otitidis]|uniref:phosphonate ABC transporter ATP-binding protein n=1 Tax=Corynebacterium otitidis TaxID=29321 RepID=UPI000627AA7E|nr:phosphonate ABC transporter ATP-binding protein [Corynebacterium otitidis]KKO83144.1 phosphonate ABC transporter ATP-binding protein [Corynebacterium otitidis]
MTETPPEYDVEPWGIRLANVTVQYPNGTVGLNNISLNIHPGEMVAVVGLSGSGKSTLIRTINGIVPATSGLVTVGDYLISRDGNSASRGELRRARAAIGMVFQSFNLAGRTTVEKNVLVGALSRTSTLRTLLGWYSTADKDIAHASLHRVGLLEKLYEKAAAISGGQQQRVAIARALTQRPRVMLADEPVASLDPPTAETVMRHLAEINAELGITMLVNLHSTDLARRFGTRLIGMRGGNVVYDGPAADADDQVFDGIYERQAGSRSTDE